MPALHVNQSSSLRRSAHQGEPMLRETAHTILGLVNWPDGVRPDKTMLMPVIEARLISAAWTLRRLPDRERGFLRLRGALWPEMAADSGGGHAEDGMTTFQARRQVRITAAEIDAMQPTLDLLLLLPDLEDRKLLFWAAWHQDGETMARIPWAKVRRSLGINLSRWTLKRRYEAGQAWLEALVLLQQPRAKNTQA